MAEVKEYNGLWQNNKMHGKGIFIWPDGRKYEGEYVDDKKEGYGVFYWTDGRKFDGLWKNGKQNGIGTYHKGGKIRKGNWVDGKRTKWLE